MLAWSLLVLVCLAGSYDLVRAQIQRAVAGNVRRTATVGALLTYPVFFHNQPVRVRGEFTGVIEQTPWHLTEGAQNLLVMPGANARGAAPLSTGGGKPTDVDIVGTFLDVGRLQPGDPRATPELGQLSQQRLKKEWPGVGELLVLIADTIEPAEALPAPSVRALALDPERYAGQNVTVTGRFRGRNLFGDLPDAPGISRWDFVIQSADAAVWVTGRRPRVDGRELNLERRIDTGRWVEVAGVVRLDRGLVRLEATDMRLAPTPPPSSTDATTVEVPDKGPPPEVVFSAPTQDETDVSRNAVIRIQFSRDIDPKTIRGNITIGYMGGPNATNTQPTATPPNNPLPGGTGAATPRSAQPAPAGGGPLPTINVQYDEGRRVMELKFSTPLDPFRTVVVQLKDGIMGTDGQALVPWKLTFSVGG